MPRSQGRLRMSQSNLILVSRFRFAQQTLRILRCQEAKGSKIRDARVCRKFREIKLGRKNREDQNWLSFTLSDRSIRQYTIKAVCVLAFHWLSATKCYKVLQSLPLDAEDFTNGRQCLRSREAKGFQKHPETHVIPCCPCSSLFQICRKWSVRKNTLSQRSDSPNCYPHGNGNWKQLLETSGWLSSNSCLSFSQDRRTRKCHLQSQQAAVCGKPWTGRYWKGWYIMIYLYLRAAAPAADPGRMINEWNQIGINILRCVALLGFPLFHMYIFMKYIWQNILI